MSAPPTEDQVSRFIEDTFGSVWAIELLLLLKNDPERSWSEAELVTALRGSETVIAGSSRALVAAGLVVLGEDGAVRYSPAAPDLAALAEAAQALYASKPDAVRRLIVAPKSRGLRAFADAFRLRKE